jgi:hypothetical protein
MLVVSSDDYGRSNGNVVISESGEPELPEEWDYEPQVFEGFLDDAQLIKKSSELIGVSPSQFVEFAIRVPEKKTQQFVPFSFEGRRYLRLPYDTPAKRTLYKCGRQVEKSTLLGNKCLAYCCIINAFNVLYVAPTNMQTKTFSQDRLKEPIETSDVLKSWTTAKLSDNVFLKKFINRSQITLRYAYHNADRTRGIPADLVLIDEIQDVITDNIPVIEQCASHSMFKLFIYSGTPKSFDNPIEHYWTNFSTQNEWVVPCDRHGVPSDPSTWFWNILGEENIGKKGLICSKCGEIIHALRPEAQWASMNPEVRKKLTEPYESYRIPQLMVPWLEWSEILDSYTTYSRQKFFNEVLGMSYDSGTRPLTRQDVIDNCSSDIVMSQEGLSRIRSKMSGGMEIFAGIDWGCHDEETRILTDSGFKYFRDLNDNDKVAQWNPDTRLMSFVYPKVRTVREWNKPLLHFKANGLDMMLSDPHRMRVSPLNEDGTGKWVTEPASKTAERGGNVKFVGYVDWEGTEEEYFVLPGQAPSPGFGGSEDRVFRMDDWLEFLGYYLSEGELCFDGDRPSCIKLSQREYVNPAQARKIGSLLQRLFPNDLSTFPDPKTGDLNWTIHGKQFWKWVHDQVGKFSDEKRVPRRFLNLSKRQLRILFDAMSLGDVSSDNRTNGCYYSTSKGLCEDFQELCIRLGLRSTLSLHKRAEGNRKARWRVSWSSGRDFQFNTPKQRVERVPYNGKVYCCAVPSGYIITERNGCIAYQGNTGENTFSVMALGTYLDGRFTIFYIHRFEGQEIEPLVQLDLIEKLIHYWDVRLVGVDYGGGFDRNDALARKFGKNRIVKYQYSQPSQKVRWDEGMHRFLVHRTEVMTDIFTAIKRRNVFRFPTWEQFEDPFGKDMLNIFSEYNEQQRQIQYKKSPDATDDSFHAILFCFLASMLRHPRPDVLVPTQKTNSSMDPDS